MFVIISTLVFLLLIARFRGDIMLYKIVAHDYLSVMTVYIYLIDIPCYVSLTWGGFKSEPILRDSRMSSAHTVSRRTFIGIEVL